MASKRPNNYPARGSTAKRAPSGNYRGSGQKRSGSKGKSKPPSSSMTGFYKFIAVIAVVGLAAALYLSGHLTRWGEAIMSGELLESELFSDIGDIFGATADTTPTAPPPTESTTATTTRMTAATSTASPTTTTTAVVTTTTTAAEPEGQNADYVKSPDYESPYYIIVFIGSQSVVVYGKDENGFYNVQTKSFTCSTGTADSPTVTGMYSILRSYRWRLLMGGVYGQYCSGISKSYLFHSVLYDTTDESTLFENSYNNLGSPASHGCIRLCVRDAKWIYDNCPHGTQVRIVSASGPEGESELPEIKSGSRYRGWEPTDPHEDNPYNN